MTKAEREEFSARYERGEIRFPVVEILTCTCRSFTWPHSPERHKELAADWDWRTPQERADVIYREYGVK